MLPTVTPPEKNMHGSQERAYRKSGDVCLKKIENSFKTHANSKPEGEKAPLMGTELEKNNFKPLKLHYLSSFFPFLTTFTLKSSQTTAAFWTCAQQCSWSDDAPLKSVGERLNWARRHKGILVVSVFGRNIKEGGIYLELYFIYARASYIRKSKAA